MDAGSESLRVSEDPVCNCVRDSPVAHESGKIALFDAKTGDEVLNNERAHMDVVTDLQLSTDRSYFITSSKDKTARVRVEVFWVGTMFV